ncbi:hypothetical protein [Sphingomonas xanthus]|uniref:Uncharacterized protein n=1 Tax=Sphingomonas xanthus TaxID=2594473 RepID=A0A516IQE9_9SPHN|nr:hypothetical protein [Sphingomonas xanthus]QDP18994.1 hypothetical protein FMM02_02875 [Sphingomonas xanthus]
MPFRHAHWWVLSLFPLAALAFWPNYLSVLSTSPPSFHFHGITATMWLLLLAMQSWSIHHGHRRFHRANGLVSLALFPLFLAGGATIFVGMAQRHVSAATPFSAIWPPHLAWLDFVAVGGMAYFYFQALKQRRKIGPHASHLLATALFLMPPILGRLAPLLMGIDFSQPGAFERLGPSFHLGNGATAMIAFIIAVRAGRTNGRPFAIAGGLTLLSSLLFEFPGGTAAWKQLYVHAAAIPTWPMALAATLAGAGIGWAGWVAGKRPVPAGALPA